MESQFVEVTPNVVIDVRVVAPRDRHPLIFGTLEGLEVGECFQVISDHPPTPLISHIQLAYEGRYSFTYLVEGPDDWHFQIGRVA